MFDNIDLSEIAIFLMGLALFSFAVIFGVCVKVDYDLQKEKINIIQDMVNNGAECNDLIKILDVKMD